MYDTVKTSLRLLGICLGCVILAQSQGALAQDQAQEVIETVEPVPVGEETSPVEAPEAAIDQNAQEQVAGTPFSLMENNDINPARIPSLFFTDDALALLQDAVNGLITSRMTAGDDGKDPGIRELALGGIVYRGNEDWTIWLNGRRVTPGAIPEQVYDLDVSKAYVDIKWYDAYTNRLYPVRLRPNQRFNLDSRLFLTGTHSDDQQL